MAALIMTMSVFTTITASAEEGDPPTTEAPVPPDIDPATPALTPEVPVVDYKTETITVSSDKGTVFYAIDKTGASDISNAEKLEGDAKTKFENAVPGKKAALKWYPVYGGKINVSLLIPKTNKNDDTKPMTIVLKGSAVSTDLKFVKILGRPEVKEKEKDTDLTADGKVALSKNTVYVIDPADTTKTYLGQLGLGKGKGSIDPDASELEVMIGDAKSGAIWVGADTLIGEGKLALGNFPLGASASIRYKATETAPASNEFKIKIPAQPKAPAIKITPEVTGAKPKPAAISGLKKPTYATDKTTLKTAMYYSLDGKFTAEKFITDTMAARKAPAELLYDMGITSGTAGGVVYFVTLDAKGNFSAPTVVDFKDYTSAPGSVAKATALKINAEPADATGTSKFKGLSNAATGNKLVYEVVTTEPTSVDVSKVTTSLTEAKNGGNIASAAKDKFVVVYEVNASGVVVKWNYLKLTEAMIKAADEEPTTIAITATLTATAGETTPSITITLSEAVAGFSADDITLTAGNTGAEKGTLSGSGTSYTLDIGTVTTSGDITIAIAKDGYAFTLDPTSGVVAVTKAED